MKPLRILITGSQGVLGTALKRELRQRGHTVFGCDLKHSDEHREYRADVAEWNQLKSVFEAANAGLGIDLVYHLAGEFGRLNGAEFYSELWRTNCIGTRNVITLCLDYECRLVFASSSEAYGKLADEVHNLKESLLIDHVPKFYCEYALTKWIGEKQVEMARENAKLDAVSLRFFNVYGPGEFYSPYRSVVARFVYQLLHHQPITVYKGSRDFLYITDWVNTVANVATRFDDLTEPAYNIGGLVSTPIIELAGVIAKACGLSIADPLIKCAGAEPTNVQEKMPDIRLATRDLSHLPVVDLEAGVAMTVAWMRQRYNVAASANLNKNESE